MTTTQALKLQRAILAAGPDVAGMTARIGAERRDSARLECKNVETKPNSDAPSARRREGLCPRQRAAARLLASGHTVAAASRTLKIGRRTIFTWLKMPAFNGEIESTLPQLKIQQQAPIRPGTSGAEPLQSPARQTQKPGALSRQESAGDSDPVFREMDEVIRRLTYGDDNNGANRHGSARNGAIRRGPS